MKTIRLAIIAAVAVSLTARAAPITVITNYFPGYVSVTQNWSTAANSGLVAGTPYVCIPLAQLTNNLTAANVVATGAASDVRKLMYAINDRAYTSYTALAVTNRPASAQIVRTTSSTSTTGYSTTHSLRTSWTLSTAVLTPE
jgi:hypothetical protein